MNKLEQTLTTLRKTYVLMLSKGHSKQNLPHLSKNIMDIKRILERINK